MLKSLSSTSHIYILIFILACPALQPQCSAANLYATQSIKAGTRIKSNMFTLKSGTLSPPIRSILGQKYLIDISQNELMSKYFLYTKRDHEFGYLRLPLKFQAYKFLKQIDDKPHLNFMLICKLDESEYWGQITDYSIKNGLLIKCTLENAISFVEKSHHRKKHFSYAHLPSDKVRFKLNYIRKDSDIPIYEFKDFDDF